MNSKITKLPNGLKIITVEMSEAQSVSAHILIGTGSRQEDFKVNGGVSHFLEHLLFKGTKKRPSAKIISEQIDEVGGWNNAYTSNDVTNYYVKVPKRHAALALDILADMMTGSLLDPEEVNRERGVIVEEMNVYRDDPARFVGVLLPPLLWPGDPLGYDIIGTEEVINKIPRDAVASYMQKHYQPSNMVVAVAGRIKHEAVVEQVKELLGGLKKGQVAKIKPVGPKIAKELSNVVAKDTAQAHFTIGCRAYPYDHPDDPASKIITNILGRGMSSRLFVNVRERKGLAYSVYAAVQNFVDTGMFEAYAGVNLDKIPQAVEAVMEELSRIRHEMVSAEELEKAKNQARGGLQMSMEVNVNVANYFGTQLVLLDKVEDTEQTLEKIEAVTAEDVLRVAKQMLAPANLRMGIIAPDPKEAEKTFKKLVEEK